MRQLLFLAGWCIRKFRLLLLRVCQTAVLLRRAIAGQAIVQVVVKDGLVQDVWGIPIGATYTVFDWDVLEDSRSIAELVNFYGDEYTVPDVTSDGSEWDAFANWLAEYVIWRW